MAKQEIGLDCPPGDPRPGDLIEDIIEGTGLEVREPEFKLFGHWRWKYDDVPEELWKKALPILKQRITALYHQGVIRAGAWEGPE